MKPDIDKLVRDIGELAVLQQKLARQAEQQYALEVDAILRSRCRDPRRIEWALDGMLDFCFDTQMLLWYKKLCRYYFDIFPSATVSYIHAYRDMWDDEKN